MSLETELAIFVHNRPAFWTPIANFYSVSTSIIPVVDTRILARLCYGNAPAIADVAPYLVWDGPFDYDQGEVSGGAIKNKTAKFWFTVYSQFLDDASLWIKAIENDLVSLFVPGYYAPLTTVRIMSMLYVKGSKFPSRNDQVQRTGEEFPVNGFTIAYQICWQE